MKNFQCLLVDINEESSIKMDQIKQLCETLPGDNGIFLKHETVGIYQFIEHVGLESGRPVVENRNKDEDINLETAKQMQVNLSEETNEERQSGIAEVEEELIEAVNTVTQPRPRPSASSSPGLGLTVRIVNEILDDEDKPSIIQVEDIAADNQQNEENIQYEIATSEESQALGILFADTLLKCLAEEQSMVKRNLSGMGA